MYQDIQLFHNAFGAFVEDPYDDVMESSKDDGELSLVHLWVYLWRAFLQPVEIETKYLLSERRNVLVISH